MVRSMLPTASWSTGSSDLILRCITPEWVELSLTVLWLPSISFEPGKHRSSSDACRVLHVGKHIVRGFCYIMSFRSIVSPKHKKYCTDHSMRLPIFFTCILQMPLHWNMFTLFHRQAVNCGFLNWSHRVSYLCLFSGESSHSLFQIFLFWQWSWIVWTIRRSYPEVGILTQLSLSLPFVIYFSKPYIKTT